MYLSIAAIAIAGIITVLMSDVVSARLNKQ